VDPDSKRLRVSVTDGLGRPVRDGGLSRWLESVAPARARGDVAVALLGDARVRSLNRAYRRKDRVTDVLSFPADAVFPPRIERRVAGGGGRRAVLGDIVIATGLAKRQARDAGHSAQIELRVLALHGLLHLLGYDHHDPDDRGRMARMEARLRRKGGLTAGLMERAGERAGRQNGRS
jgi:probable rRNA maturation factor